MKVFVVINQSFNLLDKLIESINFILSVLFKYCERPCVDKHLQQILSFESFISGNLIKVVVLNFCNDEIRNLKITKSQLLILWFGLQIS